MGDLKKMLARCVGGALNSIMIMLLIAVLLGASAACVAGAVGQLQALEGLAGIAP